MVQECSLRCQLVNAVLVASRSGAPPFLPLLSHSPHSFLVGRYLSPYGDGSQDLRCQL